MSEVLLKRIKELEEELESLKNNKTVTEKSTNSENIENCNFTALESEEDLLFYLKTIFL